MAETKFPLPRISDDRVIAFFEKLSNGASYAPEFRVAGFDKPFGFGSNELARVRQAAKFSIQYVHIYKSNPQNSNQSFDLTFNRNVPGNSVALPDQIQLNNRNDFEPFQSILAITEAVADTFTLGDLTGSAFSAEPEAFAKVISSHQDIIGNLERNLSEISSHFTEERLKLQTEQATFLKEKQDEYATKAQTLEEEYRQKLDVLAERQKQLDDRDNMHARRAIRADIKKRLLQYSENFTLTEKTRKLRWRIHAAVGVTLFAMFALIAYLYFEGVTDASSPTALYIFSAKSALLTIAALGILTWYIRWMNRWFDRHADAEFNLKQFELDVDRASWVVETAMEWRASQNGVIPAHLLESISRNLFSRSESSCDHEMNPADYLAAAILGSASRAKISIAGNEIELDRRGIKEVQKAK